MSQQTPPLPQPLDRLRSLLGVEAGEGMRLGMLTALYAVLTMGVVFVQTIAFTLFLNEFGPRGLPYSYLATAGLASLVAFGYLKLSERVSFPALLTINVSFLVVGCALFWLWLSSPVARCAIFLLPAWFQTLINLVNLAIWPLAGRLFNVRQAKRLFGLVGTGNWLANILGGFIVGPLVLWLGDGLTIMPLGGYAPFSVRAWMPLGSTGVIRGAVRNATVVADQAVAVLMIPKDVYLRHWHHTYTAAELRQRWSYLSP